MAMPSGQANAQKIIHIGPGKPLIVKSIRVGTRIASPPAFGQIPEALSRIAGFALPDQRLFPPYYQAKRSWHRNLQLRSHIAPGKTVQGGSRYSSRINVGKTVEGGSRYASRIKAGKTVRGGSHFATRIRAGKTVEKGSPWRSTRRNWRFSGIEAPVRPKGIPYFRAPWSRKN